MSIRENLTQQLEDLYADRDLMFQELGVTDSEQVVSMVRNLEAQLADFYAEYGGIADREAGAPALLLAQVERLSERLDAIYPSKEVSLQVEGDRPVVKAVWRKAAA